MEKEKYNIKCEVKGNWKEISDVSEKTEEAMRETAKKDNIKDRELNKWKKWKPKDNKSIEDIEQDTIEINCCDEIDGNGIKSKIISVISGTEKIIYNLMIKTNDLYFEGENFSAKLKEGSNEYKMVLYPRNEQLKKKLWKKI
ncbi:MAG: hypothetical protein ABEK17_04775 [Candidatus Aenigmatarchaeota archaeon]